MCDERRFLVAVLLAVAPVSACHSTPARLAAELAGPARADPLVFHGNCFAGWQLRVELRVRETEGVAAWIEKLDLQLSDEGLGHTVAEESLAVAALEERYGDRVIPASGARLFPIGGPSGDRPVGPIVLTGTLQARDEGGNTVATSFHLVASSLDVLDPTLGPGGACPAG